MLWIILALNAASLATSGAAVYFARKSTLSERSAERPTQITVQPTVAGAMSGLGAEIAKFARFIST